MLEKSLPDMLILSFILYTILQLNLKKGESIEIDFKTKNVVSLESTSLFFLISWFAHKSFRIWSYSFPSSMVQKHECLMETMATSLREFSCKIDAFPLLSLTQVSIVHTMNE
jgi:hypothetical protein